MARAAGLADTLAAPASTTTTAATAPSVPAPKPSGFIKIHSSHQPPTDPSSQVSETSLHERAAAPAFQKISFSPPKNAAVTSGRLIPNTIPHDMPIKDGGTARAPVPHISAESVPANWRQRTPAFLAAGSAISEQAGISTPAQNRLANLQSTELDNDGPDSLLVSASQQSRPGEQRKAIKIQMRPIAR